MKIYKEIEATDFEEDSWCCEDFWKIIHENNLEAQFNDLAEEMFPDGCEKIDFNDWIRFDGDMILEMLGYEEEEEDEK